MDAQSAFQISFDFPTSKPVVVEPSAGQITSDAGLLPFRLFDERIGFTRKFAGALEDRRHGSYIDHSFLEMTRMRVYGILADYADQNDHDVLRSDPVFKLVCDRSIEDDDLASQPTLSRFEKTIDVQSFFRLRDVLMDQFIASFDQPPTQLTLDIDPFDDPTHGDQQLTFFHGYYDHLHTAAYNLLARMRRHVAEPPSEPADSEVPAEAFSGRRRRQWHNQRRKHDPLGEGQPCTWRTRLIKVGARIVETTRRVIVQLSSSWPYLDHYQKISRQVLASGRAAWDTG